MSVATPRPPSPGGQNMPMMLRSQYAMYWHADVQVRGVWARGPARRPAAFHVSVVRCEAQALLVAAFVILYVLHTEYAVNRNIDIALYHCRANPTRPQCTNHPDFYPFTHSLGILNALRVLMSIVSLLTATSVYKYNHHKLVLQREKGAVAPSTTLARYPEVRRAAHVWPLTMAQVPCAGAFVLMLRHTLSACRVRWCCWRWRSAWRTPSRGWKRSRPTPTCSCFSSLPAPSACTCPFAAFSTAVSSTPTAPSSSAACQASRSTRRS